MVRRFPLLILLSIYLAAVCAAAENISRKVGDKAPNFALFNIDKKLVELNDYLGKGKVILIFYRGHW